MGTKMLAPASLYALWKHRHAYIPIEDLGRLREHVAETRPLLLNEVDRDITTRLAADRRQAHALVEIILSLPKEVQARQACRAVRRDCERILRGWRANRLH